MNTLVAATKIQAAFRGHTTRKQLNQQKTAATTIQSHYRGHKTRKDMEERENSAKVIQRNYRAYKEDKENRPWWKRVCDKCGRFGKKITGVFKKEKKSPVRPPPPKRKEEEDYKPPLRNPYDENPAEVEDYEVPENKTLTLLQLSKIYDKKQDDDHPDKKPPPRLVAGMDAIEGASTGAYQPPKPHKVIKYHAPTPPESPERQQAEAAPVTEAAAEPAEEEEGNFFTRLFKPSESKPEEKKPEEDKPAEENVFGKFVGLFKKDESKEAVPLVPNEEPPASEDEVEEEVTATNVEENMAEPEEEQPQEDNVLSRFQNLFKKDMERTANRQTDAEQGEGEGEVEQADQDIKQDEGAFSKFTGLFKIDSDSAKDDKDSEVKEENSFTKFTGLFKKDEPKQETEPLKDSDNLANSESRDNQEGPNFFTKLFK